VNADLHTQLAEYGRYQRSERRTVELTDIQAAANAAGVLGKPAAQSPDDTTEFEPDEGDLIMVDIQTRESGTTQTDEMNRRRWARWAIAAAAAVIVVIVAVTLFDGSEESSPVDTVDQPADIDAPEPSDTADSDPAGVIEDYQEARNSGDMDALMALYADDAVITGHPLDSNSLGDPGLEPFADVDQLRLIESDRASFQRPEDATEFFNIQVEGNRVSFDDRFFNEDGDCFGRSGGEVTVEDGKITLYDWGPSDDSLCE
jgi:hypothetical protein